MTDLHAGASRGDGKNEPDFFAVDAAQTLKLLKNDLPPGHSTDVQMLAARGCTDTLSAPEPSHITSELEDDRAILGDH